MTMTKRKVECRRAEADGLVRFATANDPIVDDSSRTATFIFSDESVDRYGDTISARGWSLDNYLKNSVALWGHDSGTVKNVMGRSKNVRVEGTRLIGDIEFMPADVNPDADAVFKMVKAGFLKTVSVGFAPIKWEPTKDKSRPGGIDFKEQELLEVSIVPLPANPNAVIQAKALGIDVDRLGLIQRAGEVWACGAARDLPIDDSDAWDGAAAEKRIFADAGFDGDHPDTAKAARAFLFHDSAHPTLKGSYKEPFADIVGGELKAVAGGLHAAASRLDGTDVPDSVKAKGKAVLDAYDARTTTAKAVPDYRRVAKDYRKRGLDECADFCMVLEYADMICSRVEREAANEGDGSTNPVRFRAWVDDGNRLLASMATEETGENINGTQGSPWGPPKAFADAVERAVRGALAKAGVVKSGRRISADNEEKLRAAHDHIKSAGDDNPDERAAAAARRRKAAALKYKASVMS